MDNVHATRIVLGNRKRPPCGLRWTYRFRRWRTAIPHDTHQISVASSRPSQSASFSARQCEPALSAPANISNSYQIAEADKTPSRDCDGRHLNVEDKIKSPPPTDNSPLRSGAGNPVRPHHGRRNRADFSGLTGWLRSSIPDECRTRLSGATGATGFNGHGQRPFVSA